MEEYGPFPNRDVSLASPAAKNNGLDARLTDVRAEFDSQNRELAQLADDLERIGAG